MLNTDPFGPSRRNHRSSARFVWITILASLTVALLLVAAWFWLPRGTLPDQGEVVAWFEPHRYAWYALPLVIAAYTVLCLVLVPVVLLIAATGIAFGPWLGPIYAMAGSLTSASAGFALGRWAGLSRLERYGGDWIHRVSGVLTRNGTLAVFLLRKIPAPFMVTNVVIGASKVSYRDFIVGTLLGMGAFVVALAGFGYHIVQWVREPTMTTLAGAAAYVSIPLSLAWYINRRLRSKTV